MSIDGECSDSGDSKGMTSTKSLERVAALLSTAGEPRTEAGYLDLLGDDDSLEPGFFHRAMRSRVVPRIYERIWRPLASRVFYGLFGPGTAKEYAIAREMLDISPGERVLDVGCGPGNFTRQFARAAEDGLVVGIDASETMLATAVRREARPNLAYVRGDACALPFRDSGFDAVGCFGTLHMVEDPMGALKEMARVMAPGGRLGVITTWNRKDPPPRPLREVKTFDREELGEALHDLGLVDLQQSVIGWGQLVSARKPKKE